MGVSYAIARLIALRLRNDGAFAWAEPDEPRGEFPCGVRILRVSRTGCAWNGSPSTALVTEGRAITGIPTWTTPDSGTTGVTADVRFAASVCAALSPSNTLLSRIPASGVVAIDGDAGPARTLIAASVLKGIEPPFAVTSIDQLGHGLHRRLLLPLAAPLTLMSADVGLRREVRRWCQATGIPCVVVKPDERCVGTEVFRVAAGRLIEATAACADGGLSPTQDSLRHRIQSVRMSHQEMK
jgi:hypothetical protein